MKSLYTYPQISLGLAGLEGKSVESSLMWIEIFTYPYSRYVLGQSGKWIESTLIWNELTWYEYKTRTWVHDPWFPKLGTQKKKNTIFIRLQLFRCSTVFKCECWENFKVARHPRMSDLASYSSGLLSALAPRNAMLAVLVTWSFAVLVTRSANFFFLGTLPAGA